MLLEPELIEYEWKDDKTFFHNSSMISYDFAFRFVGN